MPLKYVIPRALRRTYKKDPTIVRVILSTTNGQEPVNQESAFPPDANTTAIFIGAPSCDQHRIRKINLCIGAQLVSEFGPEVLGTTETEWGLNLITYMGITSIPTGLIQYMLIELEFVFWEDEAEGDLPLYKEIPPVMVINKQIGRMNLLKQKVKDYWQTATISSEKRRGASRDIPCANRTVHADGTVTLRVKNQLRCLPLEENTQYGGIAGPGYIL